MSYLSVVFTWLVCMSGCLLQSHSTRAVKCSEPKVSTIILSIYSRRNQSGHWISEYELQHGEKLTTPRSIQLSVEQTTVTCEHEHEHEHDIRIKATVTASPHKPTLPGYELHPGVGHYKFHANLSTWQHAHDVCAQEGAHLAMTNSEKETKVFQTLFARYPKIDGATGQHNDHAWLGYCEIGTNGKYFTLSGDSIDSSEFNRWSPNEPNNDGVFDCLLVNRHSGGHADAPRDWVAPFVCEQEL